MSDPEITYLGQTASEISVSYSDLPDGAAAVFVDEFGDQIPSASTLSGAGAAMVPTAGIKPGKYYLSARAGGQELARTVDFYVAGEPDGL